MHLWVLLIVWCLTSIFCNDIHSPLSTILTNLSGLVHIRTYPLVSLISLTQRFQTWVDFVPIRTCPLVLLTRRFQTWVDFVPIQTCPLVLLTRHFQTWLDFVPIQTYPLVSLTGTLDLTELCPHSDLSSCHAYWNFGSEWTLHAFRLILLSCLLTNFWAYCTSYAFRLTLLFRLFNTFRLDWTLCPFGLILLSHLYLTLDQVHIRDLPSFSLRPHFQTLVDFLCI